MFFVFSDADTDKTGTGRQQHTERGKIDPPFPRGDRHISIWFGLRFFWFMIGIIFIWTLKPPTTKVAGFPSEKTGSQTSSLQDHSH